MPSLSRSLICGGLAGVFLTACASSSLVDVPPTNGVADPSVVASSAGTTQLYYAAVAQWAGLVGGTSIATDPPTATSGENLITFTGVYTDELLQVSGGFSSFARTDSWDHRALGAISSKTNTPLALQTIRNQARQARFALDNYGTGLPGEWRSRLFAEEGFALTYLAELNCSGIPLSTVDLKGAVTFTRGFSTEEVFTQAAALFDSALTQAGDSLRFKYLAAVGKGRALLDMGKFADAATAVAAVPTDFIFFFEENSSTTTMPGKNVIGDRPQNVQVMDREGGNGLIWSTDPRTAIVTTPAISGAMLVPGKYSVAGGVINATASNPNASVRGADGLEARLIEAEAALAQNNASWLTTLNALRSTCVGAAACAPAPGLTTAVLPPLADPGSANARLDLFMRERAMWLFLTGHRQGDLRRMAHLYQRDPMTLWPVGLYVNPGFPPLISAAFSNGTTAYENTFVVNQPANYENTSNPLYLGCNDVNP